MAATYDPTLPTAKDRVRSLAADVAAPFRYQDEEIVAILSSFLAVEESDLAEIDAAIMLLSRDLVTVGASTTIKQGSVSRARTGLSTQGIQALLASLRERRAGYSGVQAGISVVEPAYDALRRDQGWDGFGPLIP